MFSLVTGVYESYFASPQVNILVVGAQGAGKTTLLERLKVTHFRKRPPPPGIQQTIMPDQLLHLINGKDLPEDGSSSEDMMNGSSSHHDRRGSHQPIMLSSSRGGSITAELGTPQKARKRLTWVCPAPKRYSVQQMKDDDDDEEVVALVNGAPAPELPDLGIQDSAPPPPPPPGPQRTLQTSIGSLDSVELHPTTPTTTTTKSSTSRSTNVAAQEAEAGNAAQGPVEFDVQPKAKMISLNKIRPTIGMNLGKVELCQAKCHVWDLGGRLVDLWSRYYQDCDAVIFMWKLGKDVVPRDEDEDEDERPEITYELQQSLLNQVRSAIGDDIPFLVLGHAFGADQLCPVPVGPLYQTEALLPHYHNPMQAFMVANAATGQGIQAAMEWLVPLAKRQQAVREKSMEKLPS